ncbi:class III extradiol ring-cleavage dioxygenase [Massilia sp. R2A-15]|uniref:dioxygenase family protein n=1 Tax=Massilia sp. R2A-15 TaxID=3064278 RepID=UPI002734D2BE|nr:class III extradiol ring-cleavage dioxygenase [Massilia sp. R2A-15]WLI90747.1 class III extradiol ring-cleavage dioxygenase [Massilia sp. R2A-15]
MSPLPTIFVSHGSPMLALQDSPARRFLQELGQSLPRPKAIAVVSAHWETAGSPAVSLAPRPSTIHDFGGFPQALFDMRYPAAGAPEVAERAAALFEAAGIPVGRSADRGLDHGAWVPLKLMYPDADVPVMQISLVRGASPAVHEKLGQALAQLRHEGVLVIGSGSLTHNLYEYRGQPVDAPAPHWVSEFESWMCERLEANDAEALLDYRNRAPSAKQNHPTEEHLLPLFVAMGAAGAGAKTQLLHSSFEHGVLAMDAYAFN